MQHMIHNQPRIFEPDQNVVVEILQVGESAPIETIGSPVRTSMRITEPQTVLLSGKVVDSTHEKVTVRLRDDGRLITVLHHFVR